MVDPQVVISGGIGAQDNANQHNHFGARTWHLSLCDRGRTDTATEAVPSPPEKHEKWGPRSRAALWIGFGLFAISCLLIPLAVLGSRGVFKSQPSMYINSSNIETSTGDQWKYKGCYEDKLWVQPSGSSQRTLPGRGKADVGAMTNQMCADFCDGHNYFGTEFSYQCFCGNAVDAQATFLGEDRCNNSCTGSPSQICGATWGISIWQNHHNGKKL